MDLSLVYPAGLPRLFLADSGRIRQVLANLLSNAVKFTDAGSISVTFTSGGERDDRVMMCCTVRDTGPGIPPEKRSLLFAKFTQLDASPSKRYGGTGLGLAICKELVERMGGTIEMNSEVGRGTEFHFTLPLKTSSPLPSTAGLRPPAPEVRGLRVLLVEDNAINQRVAEAMLRKSHCEVELASSGEQALDLFTQRPFDVILMDVQMPGMNGMETTAEIRRREHAGRRTPIVALTAAARSEDEKHCLAAGMDGYLSKPISLDRLQEALRAWVPETASRR